MEHKIDAIFKEWFSNVKQLILDHKHVIMYIGLFMLCELAVITLFEPDWQTFFFVTDKGRFEWVGVSAAVAGIGLVINAIDNRRKIKVELISKSEMNWLETLKPVLANFLTVGDKYKFAIIRGSSVYESRAQDKVLALTKEEEAKNSIPREQAFNIAVNKYRQSVEKDSQESREKFTELKNLLTINFKTKKEAIQLLTAIENYFKSLEELLESTSWNKTYSGIGSLEKQLEEMNNEIKKNIQQAADNVDKKRDEVLMQSACFVEQLTEKMKTDLNMRV